MSPTLLPDEFEGRDYKAISTHVGVPEVVRVNAGIRANMNKLIGALDVEFRLLVAERSLVAVMPLAIFLSVLEVAFYNIPPDVSHSAAYATNTARLLLVFLIGIAVFYTSESIHRDRELKIEAVLWATPIPNTVLLFSKWLTSVILSLSLVTAVGIIAVLIQLVWGHTPIDLSAYVMVYGVVLIPGIFFLTTVVVALNVLLRNKYLAYVVAVGTGSGLFYHTAADIIIGFITRYSISFGSIPTSLVREYLCLDSTVLHLPAAVSHSHTSSTNAKLDKTKCPICFSLSCSKPRP